MIHDVLFNDCSKLNEYEECNSMINSFIACIFQSFNAGLLITFAYIYFNKL